MKDETDQWYLRHAGIVYGPYTKNVLKNVIVAARIDSDLQLRPGAGRDWFEADVQSVLNDVDGGDLLQPRSNLNDALDPSQHEDKKQFSRPTSSPQRLHLNQGRSGRQLARSQSPCKASYTPKGPGFPIRWLVAIAVCWIGTNVFAIWLWMEPHKTEREYASVLYVISREVAEMHERGCTDAEWAVVSARTKAQLEPMIKDLEETANPKEPIRQHLLWTARDALPLLFAKTAYDRDVAQRRFQTHMRQVDRLVAKNHE